MTRQTPDRNNIHVIGWTAQSTSPTTPLTVLVSVDGGRPTTVLANVPRSDVAVAHPSYGPNHGYDVTVPASPTAHQVCITAVHVGDGNDRTMCRGADAVVAFYATGITYDVANYHIVGSTADTIGTVTTRNRTDAPQTSTISGQQQFSDTSGWADSYGVQVTVTAGVKVPIFESSVSVQGSMTFAQNGSSTTQVTFSWQQQVTVPPHQQVQAFVAVTQTTLSVPYTMPGYAVYASGAQVPYSISGTYQGINSHDLQVTLSQSNLDGTPAANPIAQPAATSRMIRR